MAEITLLHQGRRNRTEGGAGADRALVLRVSQEEEGLIAAVVDFRDPDRAASAHAFFVKAILRPGAAG